MYAIGEGVIDSVDLVLIGFRGTTGFPVEEDLQALNGSGWRVEERPDKTITSRAGGKERFGAYRKYTREEDGVSVVVSPRSRSGEPRIRVSACLPRVLGLPNWRHFELSKADVLEAIEEVTKGLLPRTTSMAAQSGVCWVITRLDLTRNFSGPVAPVIAVYRDIPHARVRNQAPTASFPRSGSEYQLTVYGKGEEMARRGDDSIPADSLGRVEIRHRTGRLGPVVDALSEGRDICIRARIDGRVQNVWRALDHGALHRYLYHELLKFKVAAEIPKLRTVNDVGLHALAQDPLRIELLEVGKKQRAKIRKKVAALRVETLDLSLPARCYPMLHCLDWFTNLIDHRFKKGLPVNAGILVGVHRQYAAGTFRRPRSIPRPPDVVPDRKSLESLARKIATERGAKRRLVGGWKVWTVASRETTQRRIRWLQRRLGA